MNLRSTKNGHKKPHGHSIDGMVSSNPRLGEIALKPKNGSKAYKADNMLDSLHNREEGFHPLRSGLSSVGELPNNEEIKDEAPETEDNLDEPIVLENIEPKKRKKESKHPKLKKIIKRTLLAALVIFLVGGSYIGYKAYRTQKHVFAGGGHAPAVCDGNVAVSTLKTEGDSRVNVLLLGKGGEGHDAPDLTDTIMIASLDPVNKKLDLLSIPRDLYVQIPGYGSQKINASYEFGKMGSSSKDSQTQERAGIALADKVVSNVLGLKIHYNAVVNFKAFQDTVNALGGVDANVPQELSAYEVFWVEGTNKHYTLDVKAGQNHFDGNRALYFARERHNDSDFVRSQRQKLILSAIKDKAFSVGTLSNPVKISNLLNSMGNNVYTDFDSTSIKCMAKEISATPSSSISSIDLVTPPNVLLKSSALLGSTVSPIAGTYDYTQIHAFVQTKLRDSFLAKENAPVVVYNATTIGGLATTVSTTLKNLGYNVTKVDSVASSTSPTSTVLVDLSLGANKYTQNYLQNRFKVKAVSSVPAQYGITAPTDAKFVIILGTDANSSN